MARTARHATVAVLDNEALQALVDGKHPKHRQMLALLLGMSQRRSRHPGVSLEVLVSTVVRLEAGISRQSPEASELGRLGVRDAPLTPPRADRAVSLRTVAGGAPADAATAQLAEEMANAATVTVYTADFTDIPRLVSASGRPAVRVQRI